MSRTRKKYDVRCFCLLYPYELWSSIFNHSWGHWQLFQDNTGTHWAPSFLSLSSTLLWKRLPCMGRILPVINIKKSLLIQLEVCTIFPGSWTSPPGSGRFVKKEHESRDLESKTPQRRNYNLHGSFYPPWPMALPPLPLTHFSPPILYHSFHSVFPLTDRSELFFHCLALALRFFSWAVIDSASFALLDKIIDEVSVAVFSLSLFLVFLFSCSVNHWWSFFQLAQV